jgi:Na+-translocating ferredoxin:NAD+ oxidoreductase RnfG subunit
MESIMLAVKFVAFYGIQVVVVALVGVTLIAGLYQLVRDKVRESRAPSSTAIQRPVNRF